MIEVDNVDRAGGVFAELAQGRVPLSCLAVRYGVSRAALVWALHGRIGAKIAALAVEVIVEAPASPPAPPPEVAAPTIRKRLMAPPIQGKGHLRTFAVLLHEGGVTAPFIVAAYGLKQAAELMNCSEIYLRKYGRSPTDDERDRAEMTPGQVWTRPPGAPNYIKWASQPGATWI